MKWLTASRAAAILLALVLIVGAGNLWATHSEVRAAQAQQRQEQAAQLAAQRREQAAQRRQGEQELRTLCATFGKAAALKPPAGDPRTNPSRAYLQGEHVVWTAVVADLHCPKRARNKTTTSGEKTRQQDRLARTGDAIEGRMRGDAQ